MITLTMLSVADSVKGQGVGSAYTELMRLLAAYGRDDFSVKVNESTKNADVVHVHSIDPTSSLKLRFCKKPTVISVHMTPEMARNSMRLPKLAMKIFTKYLIRTYRGADYVHIVNPDLRDEVRAYGYRDEQIRYIPNFVAKSRFFPKPSEEKRLLREKYHLRETDFVCFASGQTRAGKGVLDFAEVARLVPEATFIWAGGFPFGSLADGYHEVKEMQLHAPENLRFPGVVERDEINDLLNISDLFFFPSYEELFPMSILEAASTHTPLLLRDLPEYRNILTGRYLIGNDNEEFAKLIRQIRDDDSLREKLTRDAVSIAEEYSEERIYGLWKDFYNECFSRGEL